MAFKTFNDGDVLTDSDVNTYLMKQAVIVCTTATRPSSPVEGMTIAETDTDKLLTYSGTTWAEVARYNPADSSATMGGAYIATRNEVYRRAGFGFVTLTFNRPGSAMPAATADTVATLPSGYRPTVEFDSTGATLAGGTLTVTIATTGTIAVRPAASVPAGTGMVLSAVYPLA